MRKHFLILPIGLILLSILLIRCIKEYSYEGGLPAEFTIEGAPSTCSPVSVSGSYVAGNVLDTSSYATVTAYVRHAGKYTISTNMADNIAFSASGTFTDTGKQVVHLKANGTPLKDGSFDITIPGTNGCSFNLVVKKKTPASYVLSGYPNDCSNPDVQGNYIQYSPLTNTEKIKLNVHVVNTGTYTITTDTVAGFYFSASGFFSATGNQTITLSAAKTPTEAGLLYFSVHADSSQCSFGIPVTPASPLSVYVLEYGSDTVCNQYLLKGNFVAGAPLNNTNTISFKVYVTDVGNYSIYTKKVNGIIFGTSGTFSQIGEQTIIMNGSGTPITSGSFIFTPRIIGPSPKGGNFCNLTVRVQ